MGKALIKRSVLAVLLLSLVFVLAPGDAHAVKGDQTIKSKSQLFYTNSWAVVIGINKYEQWSNLESAVNDANAMESQLKKLGFNVIKLTDSKATRDNIARVLGYEIPKKAKRNDRVLVFYAGHGHTEEAIDGSSLGYIVPVDADMLDLSTYISMDELRLYARRIKSKHMLYVMDSCYSGIGLTRSAGLSRSVEKYVKKITKRNARQMITAGQKGEQVAELDGHGIFTRLFMQGLDGSADLDDNGVITASELGVYLKPRVTLESQNLQTPQFGRLPGDDGGDFVFIRNDVSVKSLEKALDKKKGPQLGAHEMVELEFWHSINESKEHSDFRSYLAQYPKGKFRKLARNRLATLGPSLKPKKPSFIAGPTLIAVMGGTGGVSSKVQGKIVDYVSEHSLKPIKLKGKCQLISECMNQARANGANALSVLVIKRDIKQSSLGSFIGTLSVRISRYNARSGATTGESMGTFFQMPAWEKKHLDWNLAADKIINSDTFKKIRSSNTYN